MEIRVIDSKEILGNLLYIGHMTKFHYDKESKRKTEEIEGLVVEIASERLGKVISVLSDDTSLELPAFAQVELVDLTYNPYAKAVSAGFAELVERFTCRTIKLVSGKGVQ
jgi:hypothetical protein